MAIRTGNTSIKAIMEGKEKVEKPELVGVKTQVLDIVKGISSENGVFVYVFFADNKYASIPAANIEEFAAYCDDADDLAEIRSGAYDIIYNKTVSKKGRDYYTCYLEKH